MKTVLSKIAALLPIAAMLAVVSCSEQRKEIDSLKSEVSIIKSNEVASYNGQKSILTATIGALQANQAALQTQANTLKGNVTNLKYDSSDLATVVEEAKDAIRKQLTETPEAADQALFEVKAKVEMWTGVINGRIKDIEGVDKLGKASEKALEGMDALLDLEDKTSPRIKKMMDAAEKSLIDYEALVFGEAAALETRQAFALEGLEKMQADIKAINSDVLPSIEGAIEQNGNDINLFKMVYNQMLAAVKNSIEDLTKAGAAADEALNGKIVEELSKLKATAEAEDSVIPGIIDATRTTVLARMSANESISANSSKGEIYGAGLETISDKTTDLAKSLDDEIQACSGAISDMGVLLAALEDSFGAYTEAAIGLMDAGTGDVSNEEVSKLDEADKELQSAVENINNTITTINALLSVHDQDIKDLWGRVQSVVFVPEYSDGKAVVTIVRNNGNIHDCPITLKYQIKPEDQAPVIVAAYQEDPGCLGFDITDVKTRAPEDEPALEIESVDLVDADKGFFSVTVRRNNMDDIIYDAGKNGSRYSASLVLDANGDCRNTEYVNLYPNCLDISLGGFRQVSANGTVKSAFDPADNTVEIPYDNLDVHDLFVGTQAVFKDSHGNFYSKKQIKDNYDVDLEISYAVKHLSYFRSPSNEVLPQDLAVLIENTPEVDVEYSDVPAVSAWLIKHEPELANSYEVVILGAESEGKSINIFEDEADYDHNGPKVDLSGLATFIITPLDITVVLDMDDVNWSIANGDINNYKFDVDPESNYLRRHGCLADVKAEDLAYLEKNGINLDALLSMYPQQPHWSFSDVTYGDTGNRAKDVRGRYLAIDDSSTGRPHVNSDGRIQYNLYYFDWDKTYKVEVTYELPQATVTLTGTVNTVDRDRTPIIVTFPDETLRLGVDGLDVVEDVAPAFWEAAKEKAYIAEAFTGPNAAEEFLDFFFNGNFHDFPIGDYALTGDSSDSKYLYEDPVGFAVVYWAAFQPDHKKVTFVKMTMGEEGLYIGAKAAYGQVAQFVKMVTLEGPEYKLKHNVFMVDQNGENYFSQAQPKYSPDNGQKIARFSIKPLDLNEMFYFVDRNGVKVDDPASLGLSLKFAFAKQPEDPNIILTPTNILYYTGYDKKVYITAKAFFHDNASGTDFQIPTDFDKGGIYNGYYVKQFNPVGTFSTVELRTNVGPSGGCNVNIASGITLKDARGYSLLTDTGDWVTGSSSDDDGFAPGFRADDIYNLGDVKVKFVCKDPQVESMLIYYPTWLFGFAPAYGFNPDDPVEVLYYVSIESPWHRPVDISSASSSELDELLDEGLVARGTFYIDTPFFM